MSAEILSSTYLNHFVRYAEEHGVSLESFWAQVDHEEAEPYISLDIFKRLIRFMWDNGCPRSLGVSVGRNILLSSHGHVGFGLSHCRNLEESLTFMYEYYRIRAQVLRFSLEEDDHYLYLTIQPLADWGDIEQVLYEAIAALVFNILQFAIGKKALESRLELPFAKPEWYELYHDCLPRQIVFEQPTARYRMPKAWKSIPSLSADPVSADMAAQHCRAELNRLLAKRSLSEKVGELIDSSICFELSLERAAETLFMSKSTLIRKLSQEGVTFKGLMEEAKKRHAQYLLKKTDEKIEAIAVQLGYEDISNFGRSFKRWFGCSPSQYRSS